MSELTQEDVYRPESEGGSPEKRGGEHPGGSSELAGLHDLEAALRRLALIASRQEERRQTVEAEIERWKRWAEEDGAQDRKEEAWLRSQIALFASRWIAEGHTRGKTVSTPSGRVELHAQPPLYQRDDAPLTEWAVANGFLRQPRIPDPVVDWEGIKRATVRHGDRLMLPGGEIVPGVTVADREDSVTVTLSEQQGRM